MNTRTVQHLLDEEWIVAIQEEIAAMPETLADIVEPATMGQYDAETGAECDPTKYYAKLGDIEAYLIAYRDTAALWAEIVQTTNDTPFWFLFVVFYIGLIAVKETYRQLK